MTRCATLLALATLLGVSGCAIPLSDPGAPAPSPDAVAACNSRADEEFTQQNRDASYRADT